MTSDETDDFQVVTEPPPEAQPTATRANTRVAEGFRLRNESDVAQLHPPSPRSFAQPPSPNLRRGATRANPRRGGISAVERV